MPVSGPDPGSIASARRCGASWVSACGSNLESDQVSTPNPQLALKLLGNKQGSSLPCSAPGSCVSPEQCCSGVEPTASHDCSHWRQGMVWNTVSLSCFFNDLLINCPLVSVPLRSILYKISTYFNFFLSYMLFLLNSGIYWTFTVVHSITILVHLKIFVNVSSPWVAKCNYHHISCIYSRHFCLGYSDVSGTQ